ncbi:presqualene diphosphate synthase HpnD [Lichenihabitans psoromatis]|uniref:presqualene diphosphate synthase HpnD n=1 Tax=Lichenihabitans psoromatis TaxID=2528642 RepID=UPI0010385122|nr:presqualene diphosphate synthase HpnD [Lichenihabitans psoromatis]
MSAVDTTAPVAAQASGSSFYTAMRLLPRAQRDAMFEVYAFCRAVDDIADEGGARDERHRGLADWRADIDALYQGRVAPRTRGLKIIADQFGLAQDDFVAIIDGMEMDAAADIQAPNEATLDLYCDRVASAVGRLSVRIFGLPREPGIRLSHHLGRALQFTNILRDIDEDAEMNRLYLPRELLDAAGIRSSDPASVAADPRLGVVCAPLLARARDHFTAAEAIMAGQPRAATKAPRIMAAVYRIILDKLEARGFSPPRPRARVPKLRLIMTVLRHGLF